MVWFKGDDQVDQNPKIRRVGPLGFALYVAVIAYCSRFLTDGYVERDAIPSLLSFQGIVVRGTPATSEVVIGHLLEVGLLEKKPCEHCLRKLSEREGRTEPPADSELYVHDFLSFNFSKAQVEAKREEDRRRLAEWRLRKAEQKRKRNERRNAVTSAVTNGRGTVVPSPSPSPFPEKKRHGGLAPADASVALEATEVEEAEAANALPRPASGIRATPAPRAACGGNAAPPAGVGSSAASTNGAVNGAAARLVGLYCDLFEARFKNRPPAGKLERGIVGALLKSGQAPETVERIIRKVYAEGGGTRWMKDQNAWGLKALRSEYPKLLALDGNGDL